MLIIFFKKLYAFIYIIFVLLSWNKDMEFRFLFTDNRQLKIKQIFLLTFFILYGIRNADIEIMI